MVNMSPLKPVRGTHDIFPEDSRRMRYVVDTSRMLSERYGFEEISTPIFEFSEVFNKTLGETSDIVTKEMYTFADKSGDTITLRPEGTAGIARAFISAGLFQELPLKYFYVGPMFRYERPQKGRLRQFHQFGVELLGVPEPQGDIEVIALGAAILDELKIDQYISLNINTLGNAESRSAYRDQLSEYFKDNKEKLSDESKVRLDKNPLRILDSKSDIDRPVIVEAPDILGSLDSESAEFFEAVCVGLDKLGISWERNPLLVRGLDYYCHTAFEFTTDALGAQGAVLAGGRYDGLVGQMGGPPTAGIGWAAGLERFMMLVVDEVAQVRPIAMIPIGKSAEIAAFKLTNSLRRKGFHIEMGYRGKTKHRMKNANSINACAAIIIGDEEILKSVVTIRDFDTGEQTLLSMDGLTVYLERFL